MSPSDITLLERWQGGRDAKAFQELVSRHGGMVYGASSRILRNAADAEEVAQECFLALAQAKAGSVRLLGGWLHTFATHRSLDRVRADKRRQQRERRYSEAERAHVDPTWNEIQHFVDEAIAALPQELSCVVVGHFLEGRPQVDLARSLDLSPSAVSRRIDRGVEQIRESLRKRGAIVGVGLLPGMLAEAASATVPKSLAAALGKLALSGAGGVQPAAVSTIAAGLLTPVAVKSGLAVLALAMIAALGYMLTNQPPSAGPDEGIVASEPAPSADSALVEEAPGQETPSILTADAEMVQASAQVPSGASVSGVVVFRGGGQSAEGMRVLLGTNDGISQKTLTDAQGAFSFNEIAADEVVLLSYDARYDEVPEDWLRSEHMLLSLAKGETKADIRIEVPPRGGQLSGRVLDKKTGAPLPGITVAAIRIGLPSYTGKSDQNGRYNVIGLMEGEWRVRLDDNNPVFSSDSVDSMQNVFIESGATVQLDFAIERSVSVSGQVVDSQGEPVLDAWVDAVLFINERNMLNMRMRCYVKTDPRGRFTIWGKLGGERMALSARGKEELKSFVAVVKTIPGEAVTDVLLTLYPTVRVSGRFMDEDGRPVKADFWRRATRPDGNAEWRGSIGEPAETFETTLARGNYEIKGRRKEFGIEELTQPLHVGSDDISDVTIEVRTRSELTGQYAIRGIVVDEKGDPLRGTRVYVMGATRENIGSSQETYTDAQGRFVFEGLMNSHYEVHATPGRPFEQYAGPGAVNPALTPEISIVVRLAGKLRGRVLDAGTEEPIKSFRADYGALSPFGDEARWERKAITSESGGFELLARLDEDWYVRIVADGYAEAVQTGAALASGQSFDGIDFRLSPSRIVGGIVTNSGDEPIPGALVFQNEDVFDVVRKNERYAAATTDADGSFVLRSLPDDAQFIYAVKTGFAVAQYAIEDEMKIVLTEGGVIEGRVLIGGAVPQGVARVIAVASVNGGSSHSSAKADDDGYYRLTELMDVDERHWLQVTLRDDSGRHISSYYLDDQVEAVDGMITMYDISIPLGSAAVEGRILQDGGPVSHLPLHCTRGGYKTLGTTDEGGHYRFDDLPPGPVRIDMRVGNAEDPLSPSFRTIGEFEIEAGAQVRQDIELSSLE